MLSSINAVDFTYTFDNLATHVEGLLFGVLGLTKFSVLRAGSWCSLTT